MKSAKSKCEKCGSLKTPTVSVVECPKCVVKTNLKPRIGSRFDYSIPSTASIYPPKKVAQKARK